MSFIELRLRIRRFLKKYRNIIAIALIIWIIVLIINMILKYRYVEPERSTTYTPHTSVMDSNSTTPKLLQNSIEEYIKKYIDLCNDGNYQKAFDMLSDNCKKYVFNNDVEEYMMYVLSKMPTEKKYTIQNYSNIENDNGKIYIYEIKYMDDFLATGLTNTTYSYSSEKISFQDTKDGVEMNVGDYIYYEDVKKIAENEYLKIDVIKKIVNYGMETYDVKLTNRSNYTIVISDKQEKDEIMIELLGETRNCVDIPNIILVPREEKDLKLIFTKFVDDNDISNSLIFSSIRVMEKYSGTENVGDEVIQSEIDNAIAKFSMQVKLVQ